jgi:hypothetical protein
MNAKRYSVQNKLSPNHKGEYVDYDDYAVLLQKYLELKGSKQPTPYHIHKNLDISTVHITEQDSEKLSSNGDNGPLILYPFGFGHFIYVESDEEIFKETLEKVRRAGYSIQFQNIMQLAHDLECKFIQLDGDGAQYENLIQFDW